MYMLLNKSHQTETKRSFFRASSLQVGQSDSASICTKKILKLNSHYPFQNSVSKGNTLFVGEGNFSFSLSLTKKIPRNPFRIVSTCFETESQLSDDAYKNAQKLVQLGATVETGVDATCLEEQFGKRKFTRIIFQFPNVASRRSLYGQNPNHILVTRVLKSAHSILTNSGEVIITTVDSPFYEGAFKLNEAAQKSGFQPPEIFDFDPQAFQGYCHQNTADFDSALGTNDTFSTFVFAR